MNISWHPWYPQTHRKKGIWRIYIIKTGHWEVCLSHAQGSSWKALSTLKVLHSKARGQVQIPPDTSSTVFSRLPHWDKEPVQKAITRSGRKIILRTPLSLVTSSSPSLPPLCLSSEGVGTPYEVPHRCKMWDHCVLIRKTEEVILECETKEERVVPKWTERNVAQVACVQQGYSECHEKWTGWLPGTYWQICPCLLWHVPRTGKQRLRNTNQ